MPALASEAKVERRAITKVVFMLFVFLDDQDSEPVECFKKFVMLNIDVERDVSVINV